MIKLPGLALVALAAFAPPALAAPSAPAPATPAVATDYPPPGPPAPALKPGEWPQDRSDLKPDPAIRFGALPNGMRYEILRNATPPGQVSMRLRFDVGSLMERDDQQGLAHFLEHMAFNGSTNLPGRGEMVKTLERLGLAFGADTNAQTDFDATTYKFDLPKSDDDDVDTALMLLREIAGNLTLDQSAMDQERGVILSEERLRDTPQYEITKQRLAFTMDGQRPPERFPIGLVSVVQSAKADLLADIYHHYYRPERATLVIVGDIDPDAIEAKIKAKFAGWQGQGPEGADPDLGPVKARGVDYKLSIQAGAPEAAELAWVSAPDLSPDSVSRQKRQLIEQLGLAVLNRRFATLARDQNPPFIAAGAFRGDQLHAQQLTGVLVDVQPGRWADGLGAVETEVRRAVQYGVRPDELAREITEEDVIFKQAAASADTRRTPQVADEMEGNLGENAVETSPAQDLALFEDITRNLTAATVSQAMKAMFSGNGPLVYVSSPTPVAGGQAALQTTFETAEAKPVSAPQAPHQVEWPYLAFGEPGKVAQQTEVTDLDTVFVRFANGVRLTIKPTKYHEDQVLVRVRFGDGLEGLPPDRQSMLWAGSALIEGGLKQISADDAERALAGAVYGASVGTDADAFVLSGATRPADLETQMQVLTAYISDPAWRPEAYQRLQAFTETLDDQMAATDTGVLSRDLAGLLHAGDGRWTHPSKDQIAAETESQLEAAYAPSLASGPIEVVVVGDITVEKAIDAVAGTFGALPPRPDFPAPAAPAHSPSFPAATPAPIVETHTGRPDQGVAFVAWPTDGYFADPDAARADDLLGRVLELRLIDVLRMGQGVTYSPAASATASTIWPHYGYVDAEMEAPPDKLDGFFASVDKIAADLAAQPVSADELARAKKPALEALEKSQVTNEYWVSALSGAQVDPRRLTILRSAEAELERLSAADVQKAAATVLKAGAAWKLEIRPAAKLAAQAAPAAH
ncbi:MAG TPA: insulinase family protein [Caulobacteraceae bacterium]|jgi:zinc protease